jgi:hypothetical protein
MNKNFTKGFYAFAMAILFLGMAFSANAQYTARIVDPNAWVSAVAKDATGNIYELKAITHASSGVDAEVVKYTNGTGAGVIIYNGTLIHDINDEGYILNFAFGLAVTSNGDIYATTTNKYNGSGPNPDFYGNIVKLTKSGSTYTASVFKAGNVNNGAFASVAVDASDNLYCVEYNVAANGGILTNGVPGAYEVVKYPATAGVPSTAGATVIYDKLDLVAFASSNNYSPLVGLTVAPSGNVFVCDAFVTSVAPPADGGRVVKLTKVGATYTASNFTTNTYTTALETDAAGNLYASVGAGTPPYSLVEYVGAAGAPVVLNSTTMTVAGNMYPYGLAALSSTNIFAAGSTDATHVGNLLQFSGPPSTQATGVTFTNVLGTTATASWTIGNGSARAVFIKQATTGNPTPINSTTYTANVNFGSGTQIGATGWYCIYNGTGTTVNITGLTSGQTYRVMVMEYNGPAGGENYLQSVATNNPNNVSPLALTTINSINRVTSAITNAASVSYTATFGASVTGLTTANFSLTTTGTISGASITSVTGSGTTYTVAVNTGTGNGNVILNFANATGLTPGLTTTLPFAGQAYTVDKTAPTTTIGAPSASITKNGPVTYTVTYADANFNASTLVAGNITLNKTGTANGTPAITGSGATRTVTISGITGDGTIGISVIAGTAGDLAGNSAPAAGPSATFTVDNTAPTVIISSTASNPTHITPIPVTLTFSENVTGFISANVSLNTGTISNFTGSGNVYSFNIVTAGISTYNVNIAAAQITDPAGNTNTVAGSFSIVFAGVVPVQLISYTATEKNNGAAVALNWKIASEQNNDHYLLERSTDGTIFHSLSIVPAQYGGNSNIVLDYNYTDNDPAAGNNFYRLTQVDKDGRAAQLGVQLVKIGLRSDQWSIYPNPATKDFSISLPNSLAGKKQISIFDAAGKLIYSKQIMSSAGKLDVQLDKPLVSGMYTVQVEGLGAQTIFFK